MKSLFYLSRLLLALVLLAGASSCSFSLLPPRGAAAEAGATQAAPVPTGKELRQFADFVRRYPAQVRELLPRDTVFVRVPYAVPAAAGQVRYVPVPDTAARAREQARADSLIRALADRDLDLAQRQAAEVKLRQLTQQLLSRPVLRDTLRADTLGVHIKVWLSGQHYQVLIRRDAIQGEATGRVATRGIPLCPQLPAPVNYPFYHPGGWPWWVVLVLGVLLGASAFYGLVRLVYHIQSREGRA